MTEITENDVLYGRGGATNNHRGNKAFRQLVASYQSQYRSVKKSKKSAIADVIVSMIRSRGGRFLKKESDSKSDCWVDVGYEMAIAKTLQALREQPETNCNKKMTKATRLLGKERHLKTVQDPSECYYRSESFASTVSNRPQAKKGTLSVSPTSTIQLYPSVQHLSPYDHVSTVFTEQQQDPYNAKLPPNRIPSHAYSNNFHRHVKHVFQESYPTQANNTWNRSSYYYTEPLPSRMDAMNHSNAPYSAPGNFHCHNHRPRFSSYEYPTQFQRGVECTRHLCISHGVTTCRFFDPR